MKNYTDEERRLDYAALLEDLELSYKVERNGGVMAFVYIGNIKMTIINAEDIECFSKINDDTKVMYTEKPTDHLGSTTWHRKGRDEQIKIIKCLANIYDEYTEDSESNKEITSCFISYCRSQNINGAYM